MQRLLGLVALLGLAVGNACVVTAQVKPKPAELRPQTVPAPKVATPPGATSSSAVPASAKPSPDDAAIRALGEAIVKSYLQHDAKAFAANFTADGEYVDDRETLFHGREAIEKEFSAFFKANPETSIGVTFDTIRNIASGVIKAQGTSTFRRTAADQPAHGRCSLVCVNEGNRWLVASLREVDSEQAVSHHEQLGQLEWLVGDWISQGPRSEVHFECRWDLEGSYLVRDFSIRAAGGKVVSGTQRIGYDSLTGHLKTWTFDSHGGYSTGDFRKEGDNWVHHSSGVTGEGQLAAGTEIYSTVDGHRMVRESVDRIVGGNRVADSGQITIVRKPPKPVAIAPAAKTK